MNIKQRVAKLIPEFIYKRIAGRKNLQKIIGNTGWLFFDRILRMAVGLFVGVWVARYLGTEQFGLLSYAGAFVALFGVIATLGLDDIVVRNIVRNPEDKEKILGTAFALKLIGGCASLILAVVLITIVRPADTLVLIMVSIIAAGNIFQAFNAIDLWFQSQVQSKFTVYVKNTAFLIISVVKIILILSEAPLIAFVLTGLTEVFLGAVGMVVVYKINGHILRAWQASWTYSKQLLKDSWPLILSAMAITIYMKIDKIMLGQMLDDKAVGIYSVAVLLSEAWYFIPMAIVSSVAPAIIEAKKISEKVYYERIQKVFDLMAVLAYSIAIPMTFLSCWIILLLFGKNFAGAGPVLAIHIWAALFVFLGVARSPWILNEGLMKFVFISTLVGVITNVVLNLILIPHYNATGAAIATLVSQFTAAFFMLFVLSKTRKVAFMMIKSILLLSYWSVLLQTLSRKKLRLFV